ncbi:gag-pol polyprotein [Tanacetum coccineum]
MSKTRADYGLGVARPKIEDKDNFELKGQFLKELRTNTFSGSDHEDANEHIEKVIEIVDLFHIPNITIDQVMLRAFPMSLTGAASRWLRNKPSGSITTWEDLKIKFISKYCPPACTAKKMEEINNFQQEQDENLYQAWEQFKELLMKILPKEHEENSNLIKEIRVSTDAAIRNQGASIKTLEIQIGHLNGYYCEEKKGSYGPQFSEAYSYGALHINNFIPKKEKDPGSFTLPCFINNVCFNNTLANLGASVSVMPLSTYLNLGLGELAHTKLTVELADRTVKYLEGIAENMLVGIGKFVFPVDFIVLDIPEDIKVPLILGRPFLSIVHAKIDVFKRKSTLRVRRDQFDNLMPTIEECEVVKGFKARNDARMVSKIFGYPSDCDHDKKICIDCAYNLKFSYMIDFAVLENMDAYRDEGIGDVIFGEPFLREVGINAKWFEGMITIHNGEQ